MRYFRIAHLPSLFFCFLLVAASPEEATRAGRDYEHLVVGNAGDVVKRTRPGLMLMGGGRDVDTAFRWMAGRAGGGDFVVIRVSGAGGYNACLRGLAALDSVETLVLRSRRASAGPFVLRQVRRAEALFIAGGDQWDYVRLWKDTPLERAIQERAARGARVGGTSAGLAVLGEFLFSARKGSIGSREALADAYHPGLALDRGFLRLPGMERAITDSHFAARDRMGRLVAFLARVVRDGWSAEARGIGVDERTALLVEPDGTASREGSGAAYFLRAHGRPELCRPGRPLTFRGVPVYRLRGAATFSLRTWTGRGGTSYSVWAQAGALTSSRPEGMSTEILLANPGVAWKGRCSRL